MNLNYDDSNEFIGQMIDTVDTYILNIEWIDDGVTETGYDQLAFHFVEICNNWGIKISKEYKEHLAHRLWKQFEDVPMNPETECIEEDWCGFSCGTHREEIWHWFEEVLDVSVAELMGVI